MSETYPFYFDAKDKLQNVTVELTEEQQDQRARDREIIGAIDQYYAPYRERWRQNGALFNLIQNGTDDVVSNWYLGWGRLLINHAMALLTAGNPKGNFKAIGHNDYKMNVCVTALVEDSIENCKWLSHQRLWVQDLLTFGNGVTKSYSERPMRKKKYERKGKMIEKIVRDFRRSKTGIRRKSPFRCMRSHFISDPDDVPFSIEVEEGTWNQYVMNYCNAILPDGSKKYDTDQIPVGSHYRAVHLYDELENCFRTYMLTYGGKPESTYEQCPKIDELGYPIYDKPLSHYKFIDQGRNLIGGANLPGMSPLAFATLDDQLDGDMETYSICGMGIPQIIAGPEAIMQGLVNMEIDKKRLELTVPIGYEPNSADSPSALDLDVRTMYSGLVVDGKITPQPLGIPGNGHDQVMWEWLKFLIYQLSGINPEPLTGDNLQTAYQSGLLVRQMNMRAKQRVSAWSNGPLSRAWTVHAANVLSEVTVEEWEEITEDDAKHIEDLIKSDDMTAEDYDDSETDEEGETIYKKRVHTLIPVKGYKFREDFKGKNKTRTLNADSTDNTLIEDPKMKGDVSYVVADAKYLLPSGTVTSIMQYKVKVVGDPMLQDLKTQDMETGKGMIANATAVAGLDATGEFLKKLDTSKLFMASIEPAGKTEDDVFKNQTEQSALHAAFQQAVEQIDTEISTPPQYAPAAPGMAPAQAAPAPADAQAAPGQQGEFGGAAKLVGDLANGSV